MSAVEGNATSIEMLGTSLLTWSCLSAVQREDGP